MKMGAADTSPRPFVVLHLLGSRWVLCWFLFTFSSNSTSEREPRGGTTPAQALAAPLLARCYLVSRDSRYSSAMS